MKAEKITTLSVIREAGIYAEIASSLHLLVRRLVAKSISKPALLLHHIHIVSTSSNHFVVDSNDFFHHMA